MISLHIFDISKQKKKNQMNSILRPARRAYPKFEMSITPDAQRARKIF